MKALVLAGLTLLPAAASAMAPYCAIYPSGRQCKYYALQECRDAAGTAGVCVANESERPPEKKSSGNAPFCVVTRDETRCWYYDEQRCREAAAAANAACVPKD